MQIPPAADREVFWSFVDRRAKGGCWIWTGPRDGSGYGRARGWWGSEAAHRVAYGFSTEYRFGRLRHTCANRACVNPRHLEEESERPWRVRFSSKVDRRGIDQCWAWTGARTAQGYGVLHVEGHTRYAHRLAWDLTRRRYKYERESPIGHTCRNRGCVNPRHLVELPPSAKLDSLDAEAIRQRHAAGEPQARLASEYRICPSMVSRIVNGTRWRSIGS